MGASESAAIKLVFNRSNAFYYGGETISGFISVSNVRNKLTVEEVFLEFIGELGYPSQESRSRSDNHGQVRKEHYTEHHRVPFCTMRVAVIRLAQGKNSLTIRGGSHSWPFELTLPESLPSSLAPSTENEPHVKYYVRIVLDKQRFTPESAPTYPLTICPRVNLFRMNGTQDPVIFTGHNRKHVEFKGCLLRGGILPGQNFSIRLDLQNPKKAEIKRIEVTLVQHRQIAGVRTNHIIFRNNLPGIYKFQELIFQKNVDLLVPSVYLPPTHTFTSSGPEIPITIFIYYELIFKVKVDGMFTDFQVSIPVVIGTDSTPERQQQQSDDKLVTSVRDESPFDKEHLPPCYEVAVGLSTSK